MLRSFSVVHNLLILVGDPVRIKEPDDANEQLLNSD